MNIDNVNNNYNISMQGKYSDLVRRAKQLFWDALPSHTSKENKNSVKIWNGWTYAVSDPMWNRGIMGASALLTQPTIDYYNHRVDDETRTVSRNRTIAKIVAGTLVGMFVVRGPVYKMVEKMTDIKGKGRWSKALIPKQMLKELSENETWLKNSRAIIAMLISLGVMSITNIILDAPLTIFLTNFLNEKSGLKQNDNNTSSETTESEANYA